ncbi:ComEC/Rec2 family competence protein [Pirellulaceae bacterium SH501]
MSNFHHAPLSFFFNMMPIDNAPRSSALARACQSASTKLLRQASRLPMVCGLVAALIIVTLELLLGRWVPLGLLGAGVFWAAMTTVQTQGRPRMERWFPPLCLLLGATFSFYAGSQRVRAERRLAQWNEAAAGMAGLDHMNWSPVALRGSIATPVRFRRAVMPGPSLPARDASAAANSQLQEDWQSQSLLHVQQVRIGGTWVRVQAKVPLVIDGRLDRLLPGDLVEVYCRWKLPSKAGNPGQFDLAAYYAERGYAAQACAEGAEQIVPWQNPDRWRADRFFAWVGQVSLQSMEKNVPFEQFPLACALILGQRDMVAWRLQEDLLATGSIHMLSISGMHIEMLSAALLLIGTACSLRRTYLFLFVGAVIWGYTLLCGTNPPVMRAAIMLSVTFLARILDWQSSSMNNLAFAGLVLLLGRPGVFFELGTQLSFLAVAVLIVSGDRLAKRSAPLLSLIEARQGVRSRTLRSFRHQCIEMFRASFWVWFLTAPLVWTGFHVISPVAIPLNVFIAPLMLIALTSGLGMILLGWFPPIGAVLGWVCGAMLWVIDLLVDGGERLPGGHFWAPAPPMAWMYAFYLIGIAVAWWSGVRRLRGRRRVLVALSAWMLIGFMYHPVRKVAISWLGQDPGMVVTFFDVGHGCHIWIETPDRELWCYDAGRMGDHDKSYRVMADALWEMNHSTIDTMILSHADADHFNAIPGLLERFWIQRMVTTPQVLGHNDPALRKMVRQLESKGVRMEVWKAGDGEMKGTWNIVALHPQRAESQGSDNADSLCVLVEYAGRRLLLPGDLEPPGTASLLAWNHVDVDLLMAPHHGSLGAKADQVVAWCDPDAVVVSGSSKTLSSKVERLFGSSKRELYLTARDRAIRFKITPKGKMSAMFWREGDWREATKFPDK